MSTIEPTDLWKFKCDRCDNEFRFHHGMETWTLTYIDDETLDARFSPRDTRSFCSALCAKAVFDETFYSRLRADLLATTAGGDE